MAKSRTQISGTKARGGNGSENIFEASSGMDRLRDALIDQSRKARSLDILSVLNGQTMVSAMTVLDDAFPSPLESGSASKKKLEDSVVLRAGWVMLGFYEDMSIAIQENAADERILFRSLVDRLCNDYLRFRDFINEKRSAFWKDRYVETELLAAQWQDHRLLTTGLIMPRAKPSRPKKRA